MKVWVTHLKQTSYIETFHYGSDRQLTKSLKIRDEFLKKQLNELFAGYRAKISKIADRLHLFTADSLKAYLLEEEKNGQMDFIRFGKDHIEQMRANGKGVSSMTLQTVIYSLVDYFKRDAISPLEINERMLGSYEKYLRSSRQITRMNQGKMRTRTVKGMNDAAVHNHLRDLRLLFKAAVRHYNNPMMGEILIPYCPFDFYKIVDKPETDKRHLSPVRILSVKDCPAIPGSRAELARDLFRLSIYMCGMNAADMYNVIYTDMERKSV